MPESSPLTRNHPARVRARCAMREEDRALTAASLLPAPSDPLASSESRSGIGIGIHFEASILRRPGHRTSRRHAAPFGTLRSDSAKGPGRSGSAASLLSKSSWREV